LPYREYLRTPEWRRTRAAALLRAGHRCALNAAHDGSLHVHHNSYDERRGQERSIDLTVLCERCHDQHHRADGRPGRRVTAPERHAPGEQRSVSVPPPSGAPPAAARRPSLLRRLLGGGS
jgi:5-methylcytosine-specific restriction endonuclease McrA